MATIETGQYEVILRKKYTTEYNEETPYEVKSFAGKKNPEETYHNLLLNVEIRKDIVDNGELVGQRFIAQRPFVKVTDTNTEAIIRKDSMFIKALYDSVGATPEFTPEDLAIHLVNQPVLLTIDAKPDTYNGNTIIKYIIKKIEKTKYPDISAEALIDELDISKEEKQAKMQQEIAELSKYDI